MNKVFIYDGVVNGHKVTSWECMLVDKLVDGKKKVEPDTLLPEKWWKEDYTKQNGAFWYKVNEAER